MGIIRRIHFPPSTQSQYLRNQFPNSQLQKTNNSPIPRDSSPIPVTQLLRFGPLGCRFHACVTGGVLLVCGLPLLGAFDSRT